MGDCNNSSYGTYSTAWKVTAPEVLWTGGDIYCNEELLVCNNTRLPVAINKIFSLICSLTDATDMSDVKNFTCSTELDAAFQTLLTNTSLNPSILDLITLLLEQECATQTTVAEIQSTLSDFDPIIDNIKYGECCSGVPCIKTVSVKLSEHLQNILICLCAQADRITVLESTVSEINTTLNSISTQLATLTTTVGTHTTQILDLQTCTGCA